MTRLLFVLIFFLSACLLAEDAPVEFYDPANPNGQKGDKPSCSFSDSAGIDGLFPPFIGGIININEDNLSDYNISGEIRPPSTSGEFEMVFDYGRPTKNLIYTFVSGKATPDNMSWYWRVGSTFFYPENGKLYIEILKNKKVKFTWCDFLFRVQSSSNSHLGSGSFVLN